MFRVLSSCAVLAALVLQAPRAAAQDPLAAPDTKLAGTWTLDSAGSDSIPLLLRTLIQKGPAAAAAMAGGARRPGGAAAGADAGASAAGDAGAGAGGGGGRSGGRSGGGGGGGSSRAGGAPRMRSGGGAGAAGADVEQLEDLIGEIAPATMQIAVEGTQTLITSGLDSPVTWVTDKKKHDVATTKGGLYDLESSWWTKSLQTIRTLQNGSELKRDIKVNSDGSLQVKMQAKINGKKSELKLRYVKAG